MPIQRHGRARNISAAQARHRAARIARAAATPIETLERRLLLAAAPAEAATDPTFNQPAGKLGINLNNNENYLPAALWLDVRKDFSSWQYSNSTTPLSGTDMTVFGYPSGTAASSGATASSYLTGYPDGNYALQYQGTGTITFTGMGSIVASSLQYNASTDTTTALVSLRHDLGSTLIMTATGLNSADPLHDLHLMMPGYSPTTTQLFNPAAITRLTPFGTIRLMDEFQTNNNLASSWSQRTTPEDFSYTTNTGIAYEDAIALANATHSNVWWNIPVNATDAYVTDLAELLKYGSDANGNPYTGPQTNPVYAPLNPGLKIHIEYVNELWNNDTAATQSATNASANAALDHSLPNLLGQQEIYKLHEFYTDFGAVYGSSLASSVGFVFSGDNNDDGVVSNFVLDAFQFAAENPSWGAPNTWLEAFAISDYVDLNANQKPPADLTTLFNDLESDLSSNIATSITTFVNYANNTLGLPLYCYEAGQQLSPAGSALNLAAQTDPRMGTFYENLLDEWYSLGGSQINLYSFIDNSNQYGSFGLLNSASLAGSAKWDAVIKRLVPMGDASLDGNVDFNDFLMLKSNWGMSSGASWQQGDFNGDGAVNSADLALLNANINTSGFTASQLAEYNSFVQSSGTGASVGTGLLATYYAGTSFTNAVLNRVEPTIDFNWPLGGTGPDPSVGQSNFSATYTGTLEAPTTETYTFHTVSDDGVRVIINGQTIINDLNGGQNEDIGQIALVAGQKYSIEVDYFQNFGGAYLDLQWQTPTIPAQDVPTTMLTPTASAPIVTVAATTPAAVANGAASTPGVFTFSRTGNLSASLTVTYAISGNAVGGTDYTTIPGTVTFAANSSTATVTIAPLTTPLDPVPDNVTVTVLPDTVNNTYIAGVASSATVAITEAIGIAGWTEQDIGGPSPAGAAHFDGTNWRMAAGGSDITGNADQFSLASQSLSGNFSTIAQVTSLSNPGSGYSKAGVMIRASNDPGSAYAAVLDTPSNGIYFQWRSTLGGGTLLWQASGLASTANWVKISRLGNVFTAYYSADGQSWTQIGSPQTITMPATALAGLALTSHQQGTSATATFANVANVFFAAPSGFTALTGAGQVNLAWSSSPSASGYNIYRSQTPGGEGTVPYAQITSGSTLIYTDSAVVPGVTYYYTLTAINAAGESSPSAEQFAVATALAGTAATPVVSATPAPGQVVLSWPTVTGATGYTIYRGTSTGAEAATPIATGVTASGGATNVTFADTTGQPGTTYFYIVAATNAVGSSAVSSEVSASPAVALAAPLTDTNIGISSPGSLGSASYGATTGIWTVTGGGSDIWGTGDQFNFASETVSGNDTLVARVASLVNTDQNAKAGLMFRTDTSTGSAFVDLLVTAGGNVSIQYRTSAGASAGAVGGVAATAPTWLMLTRLGNVFTGYCSSDGINWTLVGSQTVSLGTSVQAGLAVTAHNSSALTTATFTNVSLGAGPTITTPPTAVLNAASTAATLSVAATTATAPPLTYTWTTAALPAGVTSANAPTFSANNGTSTGNSVTATFKRSGTYRFLVSAVDSNGAAAANVVCVTVKQVATTLSILPASPLSVAAKATVPFSATVTDQFGQPLASPTITWSLLGSPAGSINATTGLYTAGAAGTSDVVQASFNSGALTTTAAVSVPAAVAQLTGTSSANTTSSYDGKTTDNFTAVFDGNTNTYFDAPTANGNWVQLNLGSPQNITQIAYAPRMYFEYRMVGGIFEASNDPTFTTGVVNLYTVNSTPADGLTTQAVSPGGTYQYVRYVSPTNSYGNIAEMQVFGTSGTTATTVAPPSSLTATGGTGQAVLKWTASTTANVTYNIYRGTAAGAESATPIATGVTAVTYTDSGLGAGTYYYTVAAVNGSSVISTVSNEANAPVTAATVGQLTGTASANTTSSYDGKTTDNFTAVFDGNTNTYFDAPTANGNWVQLNLGSPKTITQIAYAPRMYFEYRMVGGVFEASNDPTFSTGVVTLYTVNSTPVDGLTTQTVTASGTYQYVRYVSPTNSYGNIAEMQIFGTGGTTGTTVAPPSNLLATGGTGQVSLIWTGSTTANVTYDIYRGTAAGAEGATPIATGVTAVTYTDTGLGAGTYYYTVAAVNASSVLSTVSNEANAPVTAATVGQLTGTASANTTSSYDGKTTDNFTAVFDGNTNTFFDAPTASGNYVQLDLGSAQTITQIKYAPRVGFEYRMVGGIFEASNDPTFSTGVVTLYTVNSSPADGLTTQSVSATGTYRYVRYVSPTNSYGNIAEMQVFGSGGTGGTTPTSAQLTGTASANTTSSYDGKTTDNFTAVFDGNTNTIFDAPTANGNWVQLDLGSARTITQIKYAPRVGFEYRMVGGIFEASNDPTFSTGVVTLYTVNSTPVDGLTTQTVSVTGTYRYVRYVSPANSYGNIAELQIFGY